MLFKKRFSLILFIIAVLSITIIFYLRPIQNTQPKQPQEKKVNGKVKVKYPQDYTLVLLGDSMTEKLGNSDELRTYLKEYYPNKTFEVLNYGFGSTNILSVMERLEKETFHGRIFRPILDIDFNLILIESFGHNPLSQYSLETGLQKQTETLEQIVTTINKASPKAKILFVATISPNKRRYAEGQVDLTAEKRAQWANERIAYIKNHINFAKTHNIPLVNVFEKSLNADLEGNLDYIDPADFIHPSPNGVYFISKEIAKFIFENKILN